MNESSRNHQKVKAKSQKSKALSANVDSTVVKVLSRKKSSANKDKLMPSGTIASSSWALPVPKPGALRFIDLFAGIGGFHMAFASLGAKCVFASEWDKDARSTYETNFKSHDPELFGSGHYAGDITKVASKDIPSFDILAGGFPCQAFSYAGKRGGFSDTRGTMFFQIERILKDHKPAAFFLENVRGILTHDEGKTFKTIEKAIKDLGYSFYWKVIKASDFGLPQHRPRVYMVGFLDPNIAFEFPQPTGLKINMSQILGGKCPREIGFTLRVGGRGSSIGDRRNWDGYMVDGKEHFLTVEEGRAMQGFPKGFVFPVSTTQAFKQLGNSVAVPAITAVATQIVNALSSASLQTRCVQEGRAAVVCQRGLGADMGAPSKKSTRNDSKSKAVSKPVKKVSTKSKSVRGAE